MQGTSQFGDRTTFHAIPDLIAASGKKAKLPWVVMFCICFVCFTYQLVGLLNLYFGEAVTSEVRSYATEEIPAITFCPSNYLDMRKLRQNFPGITNYEAVYLYGLMDGFLPMGAMVKAVFGVTDTLSFGSGSPNALFWQVAVSVAKKYGIEEKYQNDLSRFIRENSWTWEQLAENVSFSPISADVKVKTEVSWVGICYRLEVERKLSPIQLGLVHIDVAFRQPFDESYILFKEISKLVQSVGNSDANPDISFVSKARNLTGEIGVTIGGPNYKGIVDFHVQLLSIGNEYVIDVMPYVSDILNLRRQRCRDYSTEEALYCTTDKLRNEICTTCRMILPYEKLSAGFAEECSYMRKDEPCIPKVINSLNVKRSADMLSSCPYPCHEAGNKVAVHPKGKVGKDRIKVRFTFRGAVRSYHKIEHLQVGVDNVFSFVGGSMGLYFGASALTIFQTIFIFCGEWQKRREKEKGKEKRGAKRENMDR